MISNTQTRFHALRLRLEHHVPSSRLNAFLWEFSLFVFKQAWACLFAAIILSSVLLTKWLWPAHAFIARYDFLFLLALAVQILLLALRMETLREAKVIFAFHVIGTLMELFKTHAGSWQYPEPSLLRLGNVPLFSGFMYASVGSYLARSTRSLDLRYTSFPRPAVTATLGILIYLNFFTHHFLPDVRYVLFAAVAVAFRRTWVYFRPYRRFRRMPLLLGLALTAMFLWFAENIGTFGSIWIYPHQAHGWHIVPASKYGSWLLLLIISFILVTLVHTPAHPPADEHLPLPKTPLQF